MKKTLMLAIAAAVLVVAAGVAAALTWGGDDETVARGTCDTRGYELAVEQEDGALEVTFELQATAPGETWEVLIEQDGTAILSGSRTTDEDAELDIDAPADEDAGDEFTVTATPESGPACTATVSL